MAFRTFLCSFNIFYCLAQFSFCLSSFVHFASFVVLYPNFVVLAKDTSTLMNLRLLKVKQNKQISVKTPRKMI